LVASTCAQRNSARFSIRMQANLASLLDAGHFSSYPVVVFSGASKTTTGYHLASLWDATRF